MARREGGRDERPCTAIFGDVRVKAKPFRRAVTLSQARTCGVIRNNRPESGVALRRRRRARRYAARRSRGRRRPVSGLTPPITGASPISWRVVIEWSCHVISGNGGCHVNGRRCVNRRRHYKMVVGIPAMAMVTRGGPAIRLRRAGLRLRCSGICNAGAGLHSAVHLRGTRRFRILRGSSTL